MLLQSTKRLIIFTVLSLFTVFILQGCLISGNSSTSVTGKYLSETTMEQIQPGVTTEAWVLATLGTPTSRGEWTKAEDGSKGEIWRYEWTKRKDSSGSVFLLLDTGSRQVYSKTTYIELLDGVVTRYWIEDDKF